MIQNFISQTIRPDQLNVRPKHREARKIMIKCPIRHWTTQSQRKQKNKEKECESTLCVGKFGARIILNVQGQA